MSIAPESQQKAPYNYRHHAVPNAENPECCLLCSFPLTNMARHYPFGNSVAAVKARTAETIAALDLARHNQNEMGMAGQHINEGDLAGQAGLDKVQFSSGAVSTIQARLAMIPYLGLLNAAERFELGSIRHREGCYSALTNQAPLKDREWLIERVSHCINHCYKLLGYLTEPDLGLDFVIGRDPAADAGAIAWCGLVLGQALRSSGIEPKERP